MIDLGSIKVSSADGQSFPKSESNISVRSIAAGIPPTAGEVELRHVNSQMTCHLISDVHEWMNEIPTVPGCSLVNPQPRERAIGRERRLC